MFKNKLKKKYLMMNRTKEIGLLKILLEQVPECPCRGLLPTMAEEEFGSEDGANQTLSSEDDVFFDWESPDYDADPVVYPIENFIVAEGLNLGPLGDYENETVEDLVAQFLENSDNEITRQNTDIICDLRTLILKARGEGEFGEHQQTLREWEVALCQLAVDIWTNEVIAGVEDTKGFYLFTFPNYQTPQVNNIFRKDVLNVLGITEEDTNANGESCLVDVIIPVKDPDKIVGGINVSGYDKWRGFKVRHGCVSTQNSYYSTSFDIRQLPNDRYKKVQDYNAMLAVDPDIHKISMEIERNTSPRTNQVVTPNEPVNTTTGTTQGLGSVIDVVDTPNPYPHIKFL